jgi:uncharacterized protein (DUF885 family)
MKKFYLCLILILFCFNLSVQALPQSGGDSARLAGLVRETFTVGTPTRSAAEYKQAALTYHKIQDRLFKVNRETLGLEDQVDYDLLDAYLKNRIFSIEKIRDFELMPASYVSDGGVGSLFLRPGARADSSVKRAIKGLARVPVILENGKKNLKNPARIWTENALYQIYYIKLSLSEYVPQAQVDDPALKQELIAAAQKALGHIEDYETWVKNDLLPRSTRSPAWKPEELEYVQFEVNQLREYGIDEMLKIAEKEEKETMEKMCELARRIHPSGDLSRVWEDMKDEAPPWPEVLPMAQKYVNWMSNWLHNEGSHILTLDPRIDYGVAITPPTGRRTLSFGGAYPTFPLADRQCGYYVLTPLEEILTEEEKASRIRSYNPYWTHVISYHEWVGHVVQLSTYALKPDKRPLRRISHYNFTQGWSFYLEKMMEDEGYFETLPYMEALKTKMARLQMRMWRIQRILTKLKMAKGEMTFEEAVDAYVDKIGMERTNSYIEVQRDSQRCSPPGSEIIGEMEILKLREEYKRRMGKHYTLKKFHDNLISHGELPFKLIRRLMFND